MSILSEAELAAVARALEAAGEPVAGPLAASLLAGGRSNLTFRLDDGARQWVLRTPPRVGRTPSAHDVAREHRVTSALGGTGVPVARAVLLVEDDAALGAPYSVADFVRGTAVRTRRDLRGLPPAELEAVQIDLLRVLARLHRVDHVAVGLERFGRPDGYAERQLRRWSGQWEHVGLRHLDALQAEVVAGLTRTLPRQAATGVVHGDYRIDNVLLADARVAAVVDWELSTIGDPVADVAMMCAYRDETFDLIVGEPSAWTGPELRSVDKLAQAYVDQGGVALVDWEAHLALAYFKVATIAAGIDHRRRSGGASGVGFDTAGQAVAPYLEKASRAIPS